MAADDGQMILLTALVACLCLLGVAACAAAVDGPAHGDGGGLSDGMDNVVWAQDCALRRAAFYSSSFPCDGGEAAALKFKSEAGSSLDSLADELLKHGEVYRFSFNESLAGDYVAAHPGNGSVNIDGVLVEPAGGSTKVRGCAFDVFASDGKATYHESRLVAFD